MYNNIDPVEFKKTNRISYKYNKVWLGLTKRKFLGACADIYQRLQPKDYYDFYVKYTEDGDRTKDNREENLDCGRSEEEIVEVAKLYQKLCNDNTYPLSEYIMNIYHHVIVETFNGQMREQSVGLYLNKNGYTFEKPTKDEDSRLGIDFKVYKDNNLKFALQVKPITFLKSNSNVGLVKTRFDTFRKIDYVKQNYNVNTYYMFYKVNDNGDILFGKSNGKFTHNLSSLVDTSNGYSYNGEPFDEYNKLI